MINTIMLFAAGLGNRMRHLTENSPKTLLPILDKPILHHILDLCKTYPFKRIVINTHYLSDQVQEAIHIYQMGQEKMDQANFPEIITIYEEELLETGGAIKNAHKILGDEPIFAMNTDVVMQSDYNIFNFMHKNWNPDEMDFLLLMQPLRDSVGYTGYGDFDLDEDGRLIRPDKQEDYEYMYSGLQILKPAKVVKHPLRIFSLREYYLNSDKVKGIAAHDVHWYHASRPEDIIDIEMDMLANEK